LSRQQLVQGQLQVSTTGCRSLHAREKLIVHAPVIPDASLVIENKHFQLPRRGKMIGQHRLLVEQHRKADLVIARKAFHRGARIRGVGVNGQEDNALCGVLVG
jgi:hypothetical protein